MLELINEFVVLAKHKNFSKAARELYSSQPVLSAHIKKLEKELGFTLINRTGSIFALTPAGSLFLQYAQKVLSIYNEGYEKCLDLSKTPLPLKIGAVPLDSTTFRILSNEKNFPFVLIDLDFGTSIISALDKNLIDVGISYDPRDIDDSEDDVLYQFEVIEYSKVGIAMMDTNPLASKKHLTRKDFDGATVRIGSGDYFDSWKRSVLRMFDNEVDLDFQLDDVVSTTNLARSDLAETIMIAGYDQMAEYFAQRNDIVIIDSLEDGDLIVPTGAIWRKDRATEQVNRLLDILRAAE